MASDGAISTYRDLVATFGDFLNICIHTILYERSIYPDSTFLVARAYNHPVRQSRHPGVCAWIQDAVQAVREEMLQGRVQRIAVVLFSLQHQPLERFLFDLTFLPDIQPGEANLPLAPAKDPQVALDEASDDGEGNEDEEERGNPKPEESRNAVPSADLAEQFRATLSRITGCRNLLAPLPKGSSFTLTVELKDESDPPIGHSQLWIPVERPLQVRSAAIDRQTSQSTDNIRRGEDLGGARTTAVRGVDADNLAFDVWVEESKTMMELTASGKTSQDID